MTAERKSSQLEAIMAQVSSLRTELAELAGAKQALEAQEKALRDEHQLLRTKVEECEGRLRKQRCLIAVLSDIANAEGSIGPS
jgi:chromosome segregation ATPase